LESAGDLQLIDIRTPRLHLVAARLEMVLAPLASLSDALDAALPSFWPPPFNDESSARFFAEYLTAHPEAVGWMLWYFVLTENGSRIAIGTGGFKGKPVEGTVEIGYSIVPEFQRRRYAFEGVGALVNWAFEHDDVQRVIAETFPELEGSQALLRKLGFRSVEGASEPGIRRFEKLRAENSGIN
jgi:ribosomal-protein-alanine N-acetyltransferase